MKAVLVLVSQARLVRVSVHPLEPVSELEWGLRWAPQLEIQLAQESEFPSHVCLCRFLVRRSHSLPLDRQNLR